VNFVSASRKVWEICFASYHLPSILHPDRSALITTPHTGYDIRTSVNEPLLGLNMKYYKVLGSVWEQWLTVADSG